MIPPGGFSERLASVSDGVDNRCEGFAALIDLISANIEVEAVNHDNELAVNAPEDYRGTWFHIDGTIEQISPLQEPEWQSVSECFIRKSDGELLILYAMGGTALSLKSSVSGKAVFYKTIELKGRDGQLRAYPAFVTDVKCLNGRKQSSVPLYMLLPVVCAGALLLTWLYHLASKAQNAKTRMTHCKDEAIPTTPQELSDDPAEALSQMYDSSRDTT